MGKEPIDKNLAKLIIYISPRLLKKLDEWVEEKGFKSRSEAVRYIIRRYLEEEEDDRKRETVDPFSASSSTDTLK